jgi:CAAX prenyl protease-like protein
VTSIWSDAGLDRWYVVRVLAASGILWLLRRDVPRPSLSPSWFPLVAAVVICAAWIGLIRADGSAGGGLFAAVHGLGPVERWSWIVVRIFGSCVVLPVVEELAFRGFLLRWLVSPEFERVPPQAWTWPALLLSSLAFGALHAHWVIGTLAGLALAMVLLRRGRLSDAIVAHALTNAGIAVAVLGFGRWDLWV